MKALILLLFVILSIPVTAQEILSSGYIITSEGDTLRGLILEKPDAEMSRRLFFKKSEEAEKIKYTIHELAGFGFESGREFRRQILLPRPGSDQDTSYIFAKNVLKGETDVFVGRELQKRHPILFLENHRNKTSIQIYHSPKKSAIGLDDFLVLFYNNQDTLQNPLGVKFREKKLLRSISRRNKMGSENFMAAEYHEKIKHHWSFTMGLPVDYRKEAKHFRGAIYYNRMRPDRTSKLSSLHGIIYHHWERKEKYILGDNITGEIDKKWQMINLMPIGITFEGNSGIFRPYGYIGVGAALVRETTIPPGDLMNTGEQTHYRFLPTLNSGLGVKARVGQSFLVIELTPTVNNVFFNLGLAI